MGRKRKFNGGGFGESRSTPKPNDEWGKTKFNPKFMKTSESATPWKQFKEKIVESEHEMNRNVADMESKEAKQFLKKRNENYRRTLIESTRHEPTKWEDFGEEKKEDVKTSFKRKHDSQIIHQSHKTQNPFSKNNERNPNTMELNFKQRNNMRKLITKATITAKGGVLHNAIDDMKRYGVFRHKPE